MVHVVRGCRKAKVSQDTFTSFVPCSDMTTFKSPDRENVKVILIHITSSDGGFTCCID